YRLDSDQHRICDDQGRELVLRPQAYRVLEFLLARAPAIISRDDLLTEVWGHNALSTSGVSQAIREIRKVLADNASEPTILATRHGHGYQIISEVERIDAVEVEAEAEAEAESARQAQSETYGPSTADVRAPVSWAVMGASTLLLIGFAAGSYWLVPELGGGNPRLVQRQIDDQALGGRSLPTDSQAMQAYVAGTDSLETLDYENAIQWFERVLESAPDSVAARNRLVSALIRAGREDEARDRAEYPRLRGSKISQRERLEITASQARLAGRWNEALDCMIGLTNFFPSELDYWYELLDLQLISRPPAEARATLERLRLLVPESDRGARFWLAAQAVQSHLGNHDEAVSAARQALHEARASQSSYAVAAALMAHATALQNADHLDESRQIFKRAESAMRAAENARGVGDSLLAQAEILQARGRWTAAESLLDEACGLFANIGYRRGIVHCDCFRAERFVAEGEVSQALQVLDAAVAKLGRFDSVGETAMVYGKIGDIYRDSDQPEKAAESYRRAKQLHQSNNHWSGVADSRVRIGLLMTSLGRQAEAHQAFELALAVYSAAGDPSAEAELASRIATGLQAMRRFDLADPFNQHALQIYRNRGNPTDLAEKLYAIGIDSRRLGDLNAAEQSLNEALVLFGQHEQTEQTFETLIELTGIALEQAELTSARELIATAKSIRPKNPLHLASLESLAGDLALMEMNFDEAHICFDLAKKIRQDHWAEELAIMSELDQARVLNAKGEYAEAERLAEQVSQRYAQTGSAADYAKALLVHSDSLLRQGAVDAAQSRLAIIRDLLNHRRGDVGLELRLHRALVMAGTVENESEYLRSLGERARAFGFKQVALEIDVARARNLIESGNPREGLDLAARVEAESTEVGLRLIARQAREILDLLVSKPQSVTRL
ncbi:MAG: tetratricopeptide repeat protein, partial [Xanthomonadaceae bacterium]|nr:tetratricopeptide repeat protein [Xanthomonadaceae bacterium]